MILSVSGHRPTKIGGYNLPNSKYNFVCQQTEKYFLELTPEKIITGMCIGFDQWAANIALKLNIPYIAAVPFEGQEKKWPESSQKIYKKLLSKACDIVVIGSSGYTATKMFNRNKWMVDHCDKLLAVYDGSLSGGTYNCVNYARSLNKEILIINPNF